MSVPTSLHFVSQPLCSFMSVSLSLLKTSDCIARASQTVAASTIPPSDISSINAFPFDSNVTANVIFFISLLHFGLCQAVPPFSYSFLSNGTSFCRWEKKQHNSTLRCSYVNWITDTQWTITKTWCDWSLTMMCSYYLHSNLCTITPAMRFLLYATIHN